VIGYHVVSYGKLFNSLDQTFPDDPNIS